jgi:toxin YoeB
MRYRIQFSVEAQRVIKKWKKSNPKSFQKLYRLLPELEQHPRTGTGHPEPLKGEPQGRWSRRISKKHRLVYRIFDDTVLVLVLRAYGHYGDK